MTLGQLRTFFAVSWWRRRRQRPSKSVEMGLGNNLISRDAAAAPLEAGSLEEWRYGRLPLRREWHLMGQAGEDLEPTARLMLQHLGTQRDWAPMPNGAKPG